ncbi:15385_t:CDS:2 [Gigaspora rosea]|nr:15385_t:CDS:2 [Gigaspora rosea]
MASSDPGKRCSRCDKYKKHEDFVRPSGNNTNECSTCNTCAKSTNTESLNIIEDHINTFFGENQEVDKEVIYRNIAEFLLMYIEAGSRYYLEIRKCILNKKTIN